MSRHNRSRRRQSYNIPGHAHELTFSCYRRFAFFKAERTCAWLAEAIGEARQSQQFWLWAFVFMPDHVHLILYPFQKEYDMGRILESIKRPAGEKAIAYLQGIESPWPLAIDPQARLTRRAAVLAVGRRLRSQHYQPAHLTADDRLFTREPFAEEAGR